MTHLDRAGPRACGIGITCLVAALWYVSGAAQSPKRFWPTTVGSFITIAWEPSADPSVIGYVVYVGTESRTYLGAYNVGNRTSFVYPYAAANRRHFFAVAAYSPEFIGGLSDEVSGFGRIVPPAGHVPDFSVPPLGNGGFYGRCASDGCLEAAPVSVAAGRISAVTASDAGQVWFVEDKQHIFAIDVDGTINQINRKSASRPVQLEGLAIHPRFAETRHVYIQEINRLPDGTRELTIARYREGMRILHDRSLIVSGIRLPVTGSAPFAVDGDGRVFVAVPRDPSGPEPHEGVVFAVQRDGKYLKGASGSPMTWRGLSSPTSLVWDAQRRELWLSGADRAGHAAVERLPVNLQPHVPRRTTNSSGRFLLVPAPGGRLLRIDRYAESVEAVSLGSGEKVSAVSGVGTDVVFAVTHSTGAPGSRIVAIPIAAD
jgi:hypothetical protein